MPRTARWPSSAAYEVFDDPYPRLREVLAPELADLPPEHIERLMHARFGTATELSLRGLVSMVRSMKDRPRW